MQQQQPPSPETVEPEHNKSFSEAILTLARTHELGQPQQDYLATFPLDPHGRAIGLTIAVCLLALLIVFLDPQRYVLWVAVALLLILLIWVIALLLQYRRKETQYQRVYVCASGLLCQKLNTFDAIHWHHIDGVNYDAVGNCQVNRNDGRVFFFSAPLQNLGDLSDHIEQAVIPLHLSQLLGSYNEGLPIVFGPLRINQQGIGLTEKNVILLPWDKIQGIEHRFDILILNLNNNRSIGLPLTAHEIPRVNLAQAFIRSIIQSSELTTQELPPLAKTEGSKEQSETEAKPDFTPSAPLTNIMGDPITTGTSNKIGVVVYERGFLYLNKTEKKLDIVRWDQISQVIRRPRYNLRLIEYTIEITLNGGTTLVFPRTQPQIAGVGLYVEQKAAEWALPALLEQYDANETTAFGKLTINQTNITYRKNTLPWSEVYQVNILEPSSVYIGIKQRGHNRYWQSIAVHKIPDVYLLKLLIDHILSTHPVIQR